MSHDRPLPADRAPVYRDPLHAGPVAEPGETVLPSIEDEEDRGPAANVGNDVRHIGVFVPAEVVEAAIIEWADGSDDEMRRHKWRRLGGDLAAALLVLSFPCISFSSFRYPLAGSFRQNKHS